MPNKAKIRAAKLQVRRVFLEEWDPIGVADEPLAQDEYDGYLGSIYDMLARGASEAEIARRLSFHETVDMGGSERFFDKLLSVAKALKGILL